MKIKLYENDDAAAEIFLVGRLDSNSSAETEKALVPLTEKYKKIVLNLAELEYISSAGLRILKILHVSMSKKGGRLIVKNSKPSLMEVFEMTGFAGLLSFE